MTLGLGSNLLKGGIVTPGIVTDNLVLKHKYDAGAVVPVSDGAAFFVEATPDYIEIADNANLTFDACSFSAWIYVTDATTFPIIGKGVYNTSAEYQLKVQSDDKIHFWVADESVSSCHIGRSSPTITSYENQWIHVAATYDGGTSSSGLKIYINGIQVDDANDEANAGSFVAMENLAADVYIGKYSSTYGDGYICNVGVWSSVLTQAQIKSIMWKNYAGLTDSDKDAGTTGSSNLVSWWNLDTAYDSVVFDNHHGDGEILGSELVTGWTNNDFNSLASSGTDITSAVSDGSANHEVYSNTINITSGDAFKATFTIGGTTGSQLCFRLSPHNHLGSADYDTAALSAGTYTFYITSGITDSTSYFGFRSANQACDFSISNFSVKKINGNPGDLA